MGPPVKKQSKYKNMKVFSDGIRFDSIKEAVRYRELLLMARAGLITDLQLQVKFILAASVKFSADSRAKPPIRYYADFVYLQNGSKVVEDTKSAITRKNTVYRIKKHLMMLVFGIEIKEV
jgi:hypothetical protein